MGVLMNKKHYSFIVSLALMASFFVYVVSCCNMPIKNVSGGFQGMSEHHNSICCDISKHGAFSVLHNQPFAEFGVYILIGIVVLSFILILHSAFTTKIILRFLLYNKLVKLKIGSSRIFNLFTLIFSRGILHPKVF